MKKIILNIFLSIILLSVAVSVYAVEITNPLAGGGVTSFATLLTKISEGIAGLVGSISVIMIIISGMMYLLSAGDPTKTGNAKKAFQYAIIGIILTIIALPIIETIKTLIGAGGSGTP